MTTSLRHRVTTGQGTIDIRLNDECGNGHADFAITFSSHDMGGCCHEEILRLRPQFKPFVDLHLSDSFGRPMDAVANGFYFLWQDDKTKKERLKSAKEYLRVTHAELKELARVKCQDYFQHTLETLGIVDRWKTEAGKAIEYLESLTGELWDHEYGWERTNYERLPVASVAKMKRRIASGYYSDIQVKQRRLKAEKLAHTKLVKDIKDDARKAIDKARRKCQRKLWLLQKIQELKKKRPDLSMVASNPIYYDHTNTLTFNWSNISGQQATLADFRWFCSKITEKELQEMPGIAFSIKVGGKETTWANGTK